MSAHYVYHVSILLSRYCLRMNLFNPATTGIRPGPPSHPSPPSPRYSRCSARSAIPQAIAGSPSLGIRGDRSLDRAADHDRL
jgi:hypothetical protein